MDISSCYPRYGCKPECKECEYADYCKEGADPKTSSSSFEYDDSRSNSITEQEAKDSAPNTEQYYLTPADVIQFLHSIGSIADKSKTQFRVIMCWMSDYGGTHGKGRDGLIKGISQKLGVHQRTVQRHIQNIIDDPILGRVFKYQNRRLSGRAPDKGCNKQLRSTCWIQQEFILK